MDVDRNSIGLVKHNEIQQLPTKKDHHTSRPLVVTLAIEVRRTTPLNVRHLRIRDLSKSQRIRHQALIPVPLSLEFGSDPVNMLSARSNQVTFESLPNEGGMMPVNLFELRALCRNIKLRNKISILLIWIHSNNTGKHCYEQYPYKNFSWDRLPSSLGTGPVKPQPINALQYIWVTR
jgi:hypothetical protein